MLFVLFLLVVSLKVGCFSIPFVFVPQLLYLQNPFQPFLSCFGLTSVYSFYYFTIVVLLWHGFDVTVQIAFNLMLHFPAHQIIHPIPTFGAETLAH